LAAEYFLRRNMEGSCAIKVIRFMELMDVIA
jgi:hypothetical protein